MFNKFNFRTLISIAHDILVIKPYFSTSTNHKLSKMDNSLVGLILLKFLSILQIMKIISTKLSQCSSKRNRLPNDKKTDSHTRVLL